MGYGALTRFDSASRLLSLAAIELCALIGACSGTIYSGPGWSARVIDMETGAPIEGAIVVAKWPLELYTESFAGWLFVTEAVTNKDGIFTFPAWGPLEAPIDSGRQTRMSPNVPELSIFKPGYEFTTEGCCSDTGYLDFDQYFGSGPSRRDSWADKKVFGLTQFHGSQSQYRELLERTFSLAGPSCAHMSMPRLFAAAIMEDRQFAETVGHGIYHLSIEDLQEKRNTAQCVLTIRDAVERYLQ